jgi:hypothetical protein
MGDMSHWGRSRAERRRLAAVVLALFAGAIAGGLLLVQAPTWAPVLPLALTAGVVAVAALRFGDELAHPRPARPYVDTAGRPGSGHTAGHGLIRAYVAAGPATLECRRP